MPTQRNQPGAQPAADSPFVTSRTFDAPLDLVWRAWTGTDRLRRWFGPAGFTMSHAALDLRPGGSFHYALRGPDGGEMWGKWVFREIDPPRQLVMLSSFSDLAGNLTRHPLAPVWPLETLSTITLAEQGARTVVTVRATPWEATEEERRAFGQAHEGMRGGWSGTFDQLGAYLATGEEDDRALVVTREFDAPRDLVWEAWTNPRHVVKWWGPDGFSTTISRMDVRPGGVWKHVMHGPDGTDYPNSSVFREVVKPERIVFLHGGGSADGPGVSFVATWTFEDLGGRTRVTMRGVFPTVEAREQAVRAYNAAEGGRQTMARYVAYVAGLTRDAR